MEDFSRLHGPLMQSEGNRDQTRKWNVLCWRPLRDLSRSSEPLPKLKPVRDLFTNRPASFFSANGTGSQAERNAL
ncbi:Uncharacterized protein DAT39_013060 [Clarias magur]|uniref:Uncharacterized protein n=1 Tax=Clarias magur TaxID=1594786 RepID=A0A8J4UL62_CLAMG|nr:Uncharacterized protein DAT39_013060 [Clarias magur]